MGWLPIRRSLLLLVCVASAASTPPTSREGCPADCGGINIAYPFGIGEDCFRNGFDISCNTSTTPAKPFLGDGNLEVLSIGSDTGLLRINQFISKDCFSRPGTGDTTHTWINTSIDLYDRPYRFSNTRNKFVSIGCDTLGYIIDDDAPFFIGCASVCNNIDYVQNGSCNGIGCCETSIPRGIRGFNLTLQSYYNHTNCWDFSPCSFAFLADLDSFNFSTTDFTYWINLTVAPVTLEWSIVSNGTCEETKGKPDEFACVAEDSYCYDAINVPGYRCNCSEGYAGNPYLKGGCQDIDECKANSSTCLWNCQNVAGNYTCSCPKGMEGDGRKDGDGCSCPKGMEGDGRKDGDGCTCRPGTQQIGPDIGSGCTEMVIRKFPVLAVVIGVVSALIFLTANILWSYWALKKRKLTKLKEKFFQQNGGLLLQQRSSQADGATSALKVFSSEELSEATDDFAEQSILGRGGFGTVYKGVLSDGTVVAVKKSKITDEEQNEQFINEVVVLSHINHRNVVKLLGLCLETQVPLLIYEFISSGTLSEHIHDENRKGSLSSEIRLRIAAEIAGALAYLHSSASIPIIHRDVKTSNILLDHNYIAKVSDFGMSRLVPFDQNCLNSLVRGTFGYLDPEYFLSGQFTDKSDVYSFGVLLVELLTGQMAVSPNRVPGNGNLASYFIFYYNENRLQEILEDRLRDEGQKDQLMAIAEVAKRCLCVKREERPTMKEVAKDLEELMVSKHPWIKKNEEETENLLMKPMEYDPSFFGYSGVTTGGESSDSPVVPFIMMR